MSDSRILLRHSKMRYRVARKLFNLSCEMRRPLVIYGTHDIANSHYQATIRIPLLSSQSLSHDTWHERPTFSKAGSVNFFTAKEAVSSRTPNIVYNSFNVGSTFRITIWSNWRVGKARVLEVEVALVALWWDPVSGIRIPDIAGKYWGEKKIEEENGIERRSERSEKSEIKIRRDRRVRDNIWGGSSMEGNRISHK